MKREEVLAKLREFGLELYEQLSRGEFPRVKLKIRALNNIVYDDRLKQFVLGDKFAIRSSANIRQISSLTQLVWVAYFAYKSIIANQPTTLRDLYYNAEAFNIKFEDQHESNEIISDLETVLGIPREDFMIFPEERSAVFGDLVIEYVHPDPDYYGKRINLSSHPDGMMIGPSLLSAEFVECNADKVIAIETGGLFTRFIAEKVHRKFNAILVHTAGQAPRSTRRFIRRLNVELGLPVYILTDADPWGMHIAMVIISGSANAAHIPELNTPDAKWIGVWATDITKYKLPTESMDEKDLARLETLKKDPRYNDIFWAREINEFIRLKRKAEQQSFSKYGLSYVVDKYLPDKLALF
ncbi:MAG: DNA topoisomerase IV subunit A [Candidatus Methanomethylicia archaeon]|nr:DNA topoisomerase IV subunit A [Candidatus Methanomethylicia archaeon]